MARHRRQRVEADAALPQPRVAVLARAAGVHAVVEVDGAQPVQPDHAVELRQHAVEVARDVVARVPHVARVQAHAHPLGGVQPLDDGGQLLEAPADLRALPAIVSQKQRGGLPGRSTSFSAATTFSIPASTPRPHVGAGMHIVQLVRRLLHAHEVLRQHLQGEFAGARLVGGGIQRVGRMREDARDAVFGRERVERRHVGRVDGLRTPAARVAREELERVRVDGGRIFRHAQIALRA